MNSNTSKIYQEQLELQRKTIKEIDAAIDKTLSNKINDINEGIEALKKHENISEVQFFIGDAFLKKFEMQKDTEDGGKAVEYFNKLIKSGDYQFLKDKVEEIKNCLNTIAL